MALTAAVTQHWSDGKRIHVIGTLTPSGDYTDGGDTVNLGLQAIKAVKPPIWFDAQLSTAADAALAYGGANTYLYVFVTGTTINNGKLVIFGRDGQLAGAYAGKIDSPLKFYAIFHQFV